MPKNCITAHNNTMLQTDFKCETCFGKGKLSSYRKNHSKNTNGPMARMLDTIIKSIFIEL